MKYKIFLFIILFPVLALAQTKEARDSMATAKLNDLMDTWTLGINGNGDVDLTVYNKFKRLFDSSATIDDGLNVTYKYNKVDEPGTYQQNDTPERFDVYAHDVALQINSLLIDDTAILSSATNGADITFKIRRRVIFQKPGKYVLPGDLAAAIIKSRNIKFEPKSDYIKMDSILNVEITKNQDSIYKFTSKEVLLITMAFKMDTINITNIKTISNDITCTNDPDGDAVLDGQDSLPKRAGDFTAFGIPDYDLDGVPDSSVAGVQNKKDKCKTAYGTSVNMGCPVKYFYTKDEFDGFIGMQFNSAKINLPELNQLGYVDKSGNDAMDVLQSQKGILKNPGQLKGIYAGANIIHYFGEKKQGGISVGFDYARFTAEYQLSAPIVYTFKSFDGINFYRRQITISSLKEAINYNVFNLPVMFNYRFHLDTKNRPVIKLQAGPSLMVFSSTSNYNSVIDFGGMYQIDTITKNTITYYNRFDKGSAYNLLFTSKNINAQNPDPGANNVFQRLNSDNYDFASNKNYIGKQNLQRITVAINVGVDWERKISGGLTIKVGTHFVYAPLLERKEKYIPVNKTSDEYQSIYKSTAKSSYSALGFNIGFVYNW